MTEVTILTRITSAIFYGITSIIVVFVNKILLTNFKFPSFQFVGLGQMVATIVILRIAKGLKIVKFPDIDHTIPKKMFPLPLLYGFNVVAGLGGTAMLSLPMFTVLRRFCILKTMILEYYILGVVASRAVKISVTLMIIGATVAAYNDLTFDAMGYTLISINNLCTAALGVFTKQKLDAKDLGKYGLMYYNCLFIAIPVALLCQYTGDMDKAFIFIQGEDMTATVWFCFGLSCVCGFILNYALVLCTQHNSALTTMCVGTIKNIFVTYLGMFTSGDYVFQWMNFLGINISAMGSTLYAYVTFRSKKPSRLITTTPLPVKESIPLMQCRNKA